MRAYLNINEYISAFGHRYHVFAQLLLVGLDVGVSEGILASVHVPCLLFQQLVFLCDLVKPIIKLLCYQSRLCMARRGTFSDAWSD